MAVDHYENFPVASFLLPRRLAPAVEAIYAFARSADDLADEGEATPDERLAALARYERELDGIARGEPSQDPMFVRLATVVEDFRLPLQPMRDLLSAFRQDVITTRYPDYPALLDYCRRSADPVGRLMLALYGADHGDNLRDSDAICTALQLINFWQDVAIDLAKGRIYLPLEDLERHGVSEAALLAGVQDGNWRCLMRFEVERARALMLSGAPLALRLPGRIGWELRMVVQGGLRILEAIERADYDVFQRRPVLKAPDWALVGWRALRM
jgi:squalene synthase HpnC